MKKQSSNDKAVFPISSMIDIVFLLIIFFVVTASIDKEIEDERVNLTKAPHGKPLSPDPARFVINIHRDGDVFVAGRKVSFVTLSNMLSRSAYVYGGQIPVVIRGDKDALHGNIRKVMKSVQKTKLYRIQFQALKEK